MKISNNFLLEITSQAQEKLDSLKKEHGDKPSETHNYFDGHSLGYLEGKLSSYANIFDYVELSNVSKIIIYLSKRISHAQKRVNSTKKNQGDKPNETYNYFGGQSLGYWEGKLFSYTHILDLVEETEKVIVL
jgi:hypothetical protein